MGIITQGLHPTNFFNDSTRLDSTRLDSTRLVCALPYTATSTPSINLLPLSIQYSTSTTTSTYEYSAYLYCTNLPFGALLRAQLLMANETSVSQHYFLLLQGETQESSVVESVSSHLQVSQHNTKQVTVLLVP
jgi:hypothetical protein